MRYIVGVVKDNRQQAVNYHKDFDVGVGDGHEIKVLFNCEILSGCEFKCKGCFVNKAGSNIGSFDRLNNAIDLFNTNGYRVSTINIGPSDLFGNNNIKQLLNDSVFREALSKCSTIEFATTLENVDEEVIELLNTIPKIDGFMYDINVIIDPYKFVDNNQYRSWLKEAINKINLFTHDADYHIQMNMGNDDKINKRIVEMCYIVEDEFDSIFILNPSFFRARKSKTHRQLIEKWSKTLKEEWTDNHTEVFPLTIADQAQGGSLELNFTYCNENFFWTPFVYNIVMIGTDEYKVQDENDINSWTQVKEDQFLKQLTYSNQTNECSGCDNMLTCIDKGVLSYMQHHMLTDCVYPSKNLKSVSNNKKVSLTTGFEFKAN